MKNYVFFMIFEKIISICIASKYLEKYWVLISCTFKQNVFNRFLFLNVIMFWYFTYTRDYGAKSPVVHSPRFLLKIMFLLLPISDRTILSQISCKSVNLNILSLSIATQKKIDVKKPSRWKERLYILLLTKD